MPTGLIVSVIGHAMLLLWGIVSLPSSSSLDLSNFEAVPVDFVPIDELTRLNLGVTTAEAREEIVPEPPAPKKTVVAKAEPKETFNPDEISALLDKSQPTGSTRTDPTPPTLGSSTGSVTQEMTLNEIDALRARLAQCWNIQLAPPDPSELRVKLKMFLNPDGSISQAPQVLEVGSSEFARSAAESAVRAVRRCAPYNLPPQKYDSWREINVTFDPREMFGGG